MTQATPFTETPEGLLFADGQKNGAAPLILLFIAPPCIGLVVWLFNMGGVVAAIIAGALLFGAGIGLALVLIAVPKKSILRKDGTLLQMPRLRKTYVESAGTPKLVRISASETEVGRLYTITLSGSSGEIALCLHPNQGQAKLWATQVSSFLGIPIQEAPVASR